MDRKKSGQIALAIEETLQAQRHHPAPTLDEAKLRFQLAASSTGWIHLVKTRPLASASMAMLAGVIAGRSAKIRHLIGDIVKTRVAKALKKK